MNTDELFIDVYKLPKLLCKKEVYELLDKMKEGDEEAKEKIVKHNIRLVLHRVSSRFKNVEYDKRDLVSVGIVGLMKAILNFDTSKKVEFSTFAVSCIDNEILMFLRKLKRYDTEDSFDKIIAYDNDGDGLTIEAMLSDNTDIVEEYIETERHSVVRKIVKDLPERDREIIMLHFGFYNDKIYTQREIASMLSISKSYVSRLVTRILREIRQQLEEKGYGELRSKQIEEEKIKNKKEGGKKMPRELRTIYEYFSSYTKE